MSSSKGVCNFPFHCPNAVLCCWIFTKASHGFFIMFGIILCGIGVEWTWKTQHISSSLCRFEKASNVDVMLVHVVFFCPVLSLLFPPPLQCDLNNLILWLRGPVSTKKKRREKNRNRLSNFKIFSVQTYSCLCIENIIFYFNINISCSCLNKIGSLVVVHNLNCSMIETGKCKRKWGQMTDFYPIFPPVIKAKHLETRTAAAAVGVGLPVPTGPGEEGLKFRIPLTYNAILCRLYGLVWTEHVSSKISSAGLKLLPELDTLIDRFQQYRSFAISWPRRTPERNDIYAWFYSPSRLSGGFSFFFKLVARSWTTPFSTSLRSVVFPTLRIDRPPLSSSSLPSVEVSDQQIIILLTRDVSRAGIESWTLYFFQVFRYLIIAAVQKGLISSQ